MSCDFDKEEPETDDKPLSDCNDEYEKNLVPVSKKVKYTFEDFTILRKIGEGGFSKVHLAVQNGTSFKVAIKSLDLDKYKTINLQSPLMEVYIHSIAIHPNIIKMFTYIIQDNYLHLIMEHESKGNLHGYLHARKRGELEDSFSAKVIRQTAEALKFLHELGFIHRDVKTENILLDAEDNVKLCDFGFAWPKYSKPPRLSAGTTEYMAPELLFETSWDESIDIWALGVLAFELLVGRTPFYAKKKNMLQAKIIDISYTFPAKMNSLAQNMIKNMLQRKPSDRLSLDQVITHQFIVKNSC